MSAEYIMLVIDRVDARGVPYQRGAASIAPSQEFADASVSMLVGQAPVIALFGQDQSPPAVRLVTTDSVGPDGWTYTASFPNVPGPALSYDFELFTSGGATQYLSDVVGQTFQQYVPLPSVGPASTSQVLGLSGIDPTATAWVDQDGGGDVASVYGRAGVVVAQTGDYTASQVGADPSGSAATAQSNAETYAAAQASTAQSSAESFATSAVSAEATRAEAAEALAAQKSANLSDLGNAGTARTNLGLGTAATQNTSAFDASGAASTAQSNAETYAAGQASTAQSNAETFATSAVATETSRAEAAEALLIPLTQRAAANGVATLDSGSHVPVAQVPQLADYAPTGLTGATAASRYVGAVTSSFPPGSWSTGDWAIDQAGAIWIFASAGRWLRWGDEPHQFRPESFGAAGNGVVVPDAVMSSGSPNLACTTSTPFTSTGVNAGMHILVSTAAGSFAHLATTIATVSDTGHAVLNASATANTGGTPGSIAYFGTDDTAAIQAAINAATSYAQAHHGYAEVVFGSKVYIVAGAFTALALGNCQIGLPVISPTAGTGQVVLKLTGPQDTTPLMHWDQVAPQSSGTILACVSTSGTADTGSGPSAVIGSPVSGYGGEPGLFSNCLAQVRGIGMLVPYNATMCGLDLFGMVEADVDSLSVMAAAVVPASSAPAPSLANPAHISNQYTFGLRMPTTGNQTVCRVTRFSSEGLTYGVCPSEWTYGDDLHIMYAIVALGLWAGGVAMVHSAFLGNVQAENCTNMMGMASTNAAGNNGTGTARIDVMNLQIESTGPIYDPGNQIQGTIHVRSQGQSGAYNASGYLSGSSGGQQLRVINEMTTPGPVTSPHAVAASGSPWFNGYTRDGWFTLSATTITGLSITGQNGVTVAQAVPSGATTYAFMLPSGASYTWAGTSTPTPLTHTITLI